MIYTVLIIFLVVIFVVFVAVLKNVLGKNITSATAHLEKMSEEYAKKQAEIKKQFDEAKHAYHKKLQEAQEEAEKVKIDILRQANDERAKMIHDARIQSEEFIKQGEKARQNLIVEMEKNIQIKAVEKASDLIRDALSSEIKHIIHQHLVSNFLSTSLDKLKTVSIPEEVKSITLSSAFTLSKKESASCIDTLKEIAKRDIDCKEQIDETLIAGILITVGSLVIDASLRNAIREKAQKLTKQG